MLCDDLVAVHSISKALAFRWENWSLDNIKNSFRVPRRDRSWHLFSGLSNSKAQASMSSDNWLGKALGTEDCKIRSRGEEEMTSLLRCRGMAPMTTYLPSGQSLNWKAGWLLQTCCKMKHSPEGLVCKWKEPCLGFTPKRKRLVRSGSRGVGPRGGALLPCP